MDISKILSRKQLAWQCFYQAKKSLCSSASANINRRQTFKISVYANKSNTSILPMSTVKQWDKSVFISNGLRTYTSETADKQKEPTPSSTEPPPEENSSKDEREESLEESPRSETPPSNKPDPGDIERTPEQEETNWENDKLDKLYKVIELEVLAYEPSVLDSYQWFVITAATHLGIQVGKCWTPNKPDKHRFHLLKSAFVHKKHIVHYEVRTYHRFLTFHKLTSSTADTFLEYIERNLPEGVGLKVTRVEAKALPDYLQKQAQQ